ncbi:hypothetical protein EPYR_03567 [Erwinia pyrifoliae DSM 12163]|nr:YitT family protein [Erwinia pyrifoliae]CAX57091.1 uncharacterized protein EpC_33120 [Erwinia pyrifoliae Ep1/96]CAY75947.1 hypothetical protein EPYR_03567 [Erwinia pyrifoliae DSM 12163]
MGWCPPVKRFCAKRVQDTRRIPFYWLALRRTGVAFTLKTFSAVALVSFFSQRHPLFIHFSELDPFYATLFGNVVMGIGFIVLFRHKASLGGINILALWLPDRYGIAPVNYKWRWTPVWCWPRFSLFRARCSQRRFPVLWC